MWGQKPVSDKKDTLFELSSKQPLPERDGQINALPHAYQINPSRKRKARALSSCLYRQMVAGNFDSTFEKQRRQGGADRRIINLFEGLPHRLSR
jgi:hypothetical protein